MAKATPPTSTKARKAVLVVLTSLRDTVLEPFGFIEGKPTMSAIVVDEPEEKACWVRIPLGPEGCYKVTEGLKDKPGKWANFAGIGKAEIVECDGRSFMISKLRVGSDATEDEIEEHGVSTYEAPAKRKTLGSL